MRVLAGLCVVALGVALPVRADVVTLTTGNELRGRVLEEERAMTHMARLHERGEGGVEKDEAEAARLHRLALQHGHGPAGALPRTDTLPATAGRRGADPDHD